MAEKTSIEWTDSTWNPIRGVRGKWSCVKISPGCTNCYAERLNTRFGGPKYVVGADELRLDANALEEPFHWKRPRRIFVASMTDLFEDRVTDEWITAVFGVMMCARRHSFQVLTKRPERMATWLSAWGHGESAYMALHLAFAESRVRHEMRLPGNLAAALLQDRIQWPLPNVWCGTSIENQDYADERIPWLLKTPAAVRFLSVEPLLGPVDLSRWLFVTLTCGDRMPAKALQWVIVGGESGGPQARSLVVRGIDRWWPGKPERVDWVRSLRDQCVAAGVPFYFKQWGGPTPTSGGRLLDGRTWDEFPAGG
jgi:protein gp37